MPCFRHTECLYPACIIDGECDLHLGMLIAFDTAFDDTAFTEIVAASEKELTDELNQG